MSTTTFDLDSFIFALAWTMIQSIWQSSLIAILIQISTRCLRIENANVRYNTFLGALLACVAWSLTTFFDLYATKLFNSATTHLTSGTTQAMLNITQTEQLAMESLLPFLALVWIIGCIVLTCKLVFEMVLAHRLKYIDTDPLNQEWQIKLEQSKRRIGTAKKLTLKLSQRVATPCVIGFVRPVILMPSSLFLGLSSQQLEMIILHELAHIRRHDAFVSLIQVMIKIIFFFNPTIHHLSHKIDQEREHACDDLAIQACGDALAYARTLESCAQFNLSISPRFGLMHHFFERNSMFQQRITRLFRHENKPRLSIKKVTGTSLLFFATLAIAGCSYMLIEEPDLDVNGKAARFEISIKKNGVLVAQPALISEFGQPASFELENEIRITSVAQKPKGQRSHVESSIYQFDGKNWVQAWSPSMDAMITLTPSFEFTSEDKQYRIVIKPRLTNLPKPDSSASARTNESLGLNTTAHSGSTVLR